MKSGNPEAIKAYKTINTVTSKVYTLALCFGTAALENTWTPLFFLYKYFFPGRNRVTWQPAVCAADHCTRWL